MLLVRRVQGCAPARSPRRKRKTCAPPQNVGDLGPKPVAVLVQDEFRQDGERRAAPLPALNEDANGGRAGSGVNGPETEGAEAALQQMQQFRERRGPVYEGKAAS